MCSPSKPRPFSLRIATVERVVALHGGWSAYSSFVACFQGFPRRKIVVYGACHSVWWKIWLSGVNRTGGGGEASFCSPCIVRSVVFHFWTPWATSMLITRAGTRASGAAFATLHCVGLRTSGLCLGPIIFACRYLAT